MPEQLGVDRTDSQPASRQALTLALQARAGSGHEVRGVLARARQRQLAVVWLAVIAPRVVVVDRVTVIVAVDAVGGVSRVAPDERNRGAVDGEQHDARVAEQRLQVLARTETKATRQLDARAKHPGRGEDRLELWCVGALR